MLDRWQGDDFDRIRDEVIQALARDKQQALQLWQRQQLALGMAHDFLPKAAELQMRVNRAIERVPELEAVLGDLVPTLGLAVKNTLYEYVTGREGFPQLNSGPSWL